MQLSHPTPSAATAAPKTPTRPTVTLTDIKTQISSIYIAARDTDAICQLSHAEYIQLYTNICDYGMAAKAKHSDVWERQGRTLFTWLDLEIRTHTRSIRDSVFDVESEELDGVTAATDVAREVLNKYAACYAGFEKLSSLVGNLLGFWDRHWVRRERDEKKINVGSVREMHVRIWKEEVLRIADGGSEGDGNGMKRLADTITRLRETEGGVSESDEKLVRHVVDGLSGLGVMIEE